MARARQPYVLRKKGPLDGVVTVALGALALLVVVMLVGYAHERLQHRRLLDRVRNAYVATDCTLMSKDIRSTIHEGRRSHAGRVREHAAFEPVIGYRYRVADREYEADRFSPDPPTEHDRSLIIKLLARYEVGKKYRCWYDPEHPADAFLERP